MGAMPRNQMREGKQTSAGRAQGRSAAEFGISRAKSPKSPKLPGIPPKLPEIRGAP